MNNPVVAINVYSVPTGKEEEFLMWWYEMKETLTGAPGFISGRLHRSLNAAARFNFINVVEWENSNYSQAYEKYALDEEPVGPIRGRNDSRAVCDRLAVLSRSSRSVMRSLRTKAIPRARFIVLRIGCLHSRLAVCSR